MDMDECMIHAADMDTEYRQDEARKESKSRVDGLRSDVIKCEDGMPVLVHHRPGLSEYLKKVNEIADVYAFTAALPVYARPVLKTLDPDNSIFKQIWYRGSCSRIRIGARTCYSKNLKVLGDQFDEQRTLLVDNNIISHLINPSNGILMSSFYDDHTDRELDYVFDLLRHLEAERDVRPLLREAFDLTSHVQQVVPNWSFLGDESSAVASHFS